MELSYTDVTVCSGSKIINTAAVVDADVIVPDTKPDIGRILAVRAYADVDERYIKKDKMIFSGNVKFKIMYVCEEEQCKIYTIEHVLPFSHQTDSADVSEGSYIVGSCHISKTDFDVRNSRKLRVEANLQLSAKSYLQSEIKAVNGVDSDCDIPVKYSDCEGDRIIVCREIEFDVSDSVTLPPDENSSHEIYDISCRSDINDVKTVNNKAVIKGTVPIRILYESENGPACYDTDITFTEIEDLETIGSCNNVSAVFGVCGINYDISDSQDNFKADIEIKIKGRICAFDRTQYHIASDIYSPDYEYGIDTSASDLACILPTSVNQTTIKDTIKVSDDLQPIAKVLYMSVNTECIEKSINESSVNICGNLYSTVIYSSDDGSIHSVFKTTPYEINEPIDKCDNISAELEVSNYSYIMGSPKEIQIRCVVCSITDGICFSSENFITSFTTDEEKPIKRDGKPSITVYYPTSDMSLWDVAKKYCVTVNDILNMNQISEDSSLSAENPIIIPKRTNREKL